MNKIPKPNCKESACAWALDKVAGRGQRELGFFLENPNGDTSNICDFQEKPKGGWKHHFGLEFLCFLSFFKKRKEVAEGKFFSSFFCLDTKETKRRSPHEHHIKKL